MKKGILFAVLTAMFLIGCDGTETADQKQNRLQEQLTKQGVDAVGIPAITNFQEKRVLKQIFELRDTEIKTITYIVDMNGKFHKVCDSIGYGVPYATQYTNPMKIASREHGITIPQADPNGLYSPPTAEGTWVLCYSKELNKVTPVYIEPRIVVSPFALHVE